MLILGIDTSCDDTAAAIVEDGRRIISNIISSQHEIHKKYGGIVPELASRRHVEMIWPVVDEAIKNAEVPHTQISAIAATIGPGLIGSLLVGVCFAKSLSFTWNIPLIGINHLEGHIWSIFLEKEPAFPFLSLIVSGGHTSLYRVNGPGDYKELGRTRDDAAGEAYDKVAKLLGLGYPGGPEIEKLSANGNPQGISFPRADLGNTFDFSFSGLKTAVLYYLRKNPQASKEDIAASFQEAVIDVLVNTTLRATKKENIKRIVLSGGVSANNALRMAFDNMAKKEGLEIYYPSKALCTDNAAMIAAAAHHHAIKGHFADLSLNPKAYLPL